MEEKTAVWTQGSGGVSDSRTDTSEYDWIFETQETKAPGEAIREAGPGAPEEVPSGKPSARRKRTPAGRASGKTAESRDEGGEEASSGKTAESRDEDGEEVSSGKTAKSQAKRASGKTAENREEGRAEKPEECGGQTEDPRSIEELFALLEELIGKLEDGDSSLEDSFRYYEEGMRLVKACAGKIDRVEKQIQVINETGGEYGA